MEYYAKGDLHSAVQFKVFEERETAFVLRDIACGLNMIHGADIVHRDLKPPNILLDHGMRCAISDFGLAIRADCIQAGEYHGTECYIAPEMLAGLSYGKPLDVWCFSRILEAIVSGEANDPPSLPGNLDPVWLLDVHDHTSSREPYRRKSATWLVNRLDIIVKSIPAAPEIAENASSSVSAGLPTISYANAIRQAEGEEFVQQGRQAEKLRKGKEADAATRQAENRWRGARRKAAKKAKAKAKAMAT